MKNDGITQRIYVLGTLETASPLMIGSGEDDWADMQVMRGWGGWDGMPFIPASAIAGVLRHFANEAQLADKKIINLLFGKKVNAKDDTTQSLITCYDLFPTSHVTPVIRDGVRLDYETKTAVDKAKYDYEIVERGQQFEFTFEIAFRQCHTEQQDEMRQLVMALCSAMMKKQIALGAKTRRGFGEVCLKEAKMLTLNMPQDAKKWIDFKWRSNEDFEENHAETISPKTWSNPHNTDISVTFDIPYSILIRHESGDPSAPDVTHLTSNGQPIISGTSWSGALRHAVHRLLHDMGKGDKSDSILTNLFGNVNETTKTAKASWVRIKKESLIMGGQSLTYTRNKIDRFTGGVVDSALFDEQPHYGGKVTLDISIKDAQDWQKGLLLLALKDLGNGIQPIGGEANVGRGIFDNPIFKPNITEQEQQTWMKALAKKLQEA